MKVVARRKRYEEDMYGFRYGGIFPLSKLPSKKDAILVHKKGEPVGWEFEKEKYCCGKIGEHIEFDGRWSEKEQRVIPVCYITLPDYGDDTEDVYVDFCPFCGEKIEVVEEE